MSFCPKCGKEGGQDAIYCPNCGVPVAQQQSTNPPYLPPRPLTGTKNEGLAAALSFLFPGLGQISGGRIGRGLSILFGGIVLALLSWVLL